MSNSWKKIGARKKVAGQNIGDFVKKGGKDYSLFGGNCHNASEKLKNRG
jgi:hypothetical protein